MQLIWTCMRISIHITLKTTHGRELHICHLYFIYTQYAYSIPIVLYESHWLNWVKGWFKLFITLSSILIYCWSVAFVFHFGGEEWGIALFICLTRGNLHWKSKMLEISMHYILVICIICLYLYLKQEKGQRETWNGYFTPPLEKQWCTGENIQSIIRQRNNSNYSSNKPIQWRV